MHKNKNFVLPIKKLVTLLNLCEQNTAAITKQLPTITSILMKPKMANEIKFFGSVHSTDSINRAHCVIFISPIVRKQNVLHYFSY